MATMQDVAAQAGVSIATVSFVVNDTKPVTGPTRQRIEDAMAHLGYRRNAVARALASRRTRIIALAYPALEHRLNGSGMDFVSSAASAARERDHHLVLWPVGNDGTELTELVGQRLVDGVLLMEVQLDDARVGVLQSTGTPFAMIGRTSDPTGIPHVDIDFDITIERGVGHLMDLGHRRIVLLSGSQAHASFRRYGPYVRSEQAFRRVAERVGIEPVIMIFEQSASGWRALADQLLTEAPEATAVISVNELATLGLISGLRHRGVQVPTDISVLSVITSAEMAAIADPPLTIMRSPGRELGRLALEALVRELAQEPTLPPELVPCPLEHGHSTARPRRRRAMVLP